MTVAADPIETCRLEDGNIAVSLLNLGAITQGWWVPCNGESVPVVLGCQNSEDYWQDKAYLGAIVGRIANRTADGVLTLGGERFQLTQNEGRNHLHGGHKGLHRRIWQMDRDSAGRSVRFAYNSPDGEEGYPGEARFTVTVTLKGHTVTYDLEARVDRPTPINLAQHNYYNLMGRGTIWDHHLITLADRMTPSNDHGIPTGKLESAAGSPVDFRGGATFKQMDPMAAGTDLNLVFPDDRQPDRPVAELRAPNGLRLRLWTDQPGMQLYTGRHLEGGHGAQRITAFSGVCLEPQGFPNAINEPAFPSILVTPDAPYRQTTAVEIMEVR